MVEIGAAIARRHKINLKAQLFQRLALKRAHFFRRVNRSGLCRGQRAPFHIEQSGLNHLAKIIALVKLGGSIDLFDQFSRDRLAGLVMDRIIGEHLWIDRPHLMHLAGIFDKVARSGCARQALIFLIGKEAVQCVAKFVEGGVDPIKADQLHLAFGCFGDVEHVVNDRLCAPFIALIDEIAHPCAAAFAGALEGVEIEQAKL